MQLKEITSTHNATRVCSRAVESELKQFWMLGAGAKNFWMVRSEPEIWIPVPQPYFVGQANCTNITMVLNFQWTKPF